MIAAAKQSSLPNRGVLRQLQKSIADCQRLVEEKKEWLAGWRPDSDTLNRYKQQRRIINIDITKILGE